MVGGENALRALTPYGELLVFTSTELPLRHWSKFFYFFRAFIKCCHFDVHLRNSLTGYQRKCYLWGILRETQQDSSSRQLVPNRNQTPDNVLAARDPVNDAQVMIDELRRGKRIRKATASRD